MVQAEEKRHGVAGLKPYRKDKNTRRAVRLHRMMWQLVILSLAFVQIIATFSGLQERLYLTKWLAAAGLILCFFALGRFRLSCALATEFAVIVGLITIGF